MISIAGLRRGSGTRPASARMRGELARSHVFDHTLTQRTDTVSLTHGEFHSELRLTHLDSQDGVLQRYPYPLDRLPAYRLLLPRSGLERSDFVP